MEKHPPTFSPSNLQELHRQYSERADKKPFDSKPFFSNQIKLDLHQDLHAMLTEEEFLLEDIDEYEHMDVEEKKTDGDEKVQKAI